MPLFTLFQKTKKRYDSGGIGELVFSIPDFLHRRLRWYLIRPYYTLKIRYQSKEVGNDPLVNFASKVNNKTVLGDNFNSNGLRIRGGGPVEIGDNFHCGPGILILTRNHNYENADAIPYDSTYNEEKVTIEDTVWLGAEVTITPGVTIGEGAVIQAGSVVVDDIPPCSIAGGHPAKVFKERDKEHYYKLKEKGEFH